MGLRFSRRGFLLISFSNWKPGVAAVILLLTIAATHLGHKAQQKRLLQELLTVLNATISAKYTWALNPTHENESYLEKAADLLDVKKKQGIDNLQFSTEETHSFT